MVLDDTRVSLQCCSEMYYQNALSRWLLLEKEKLTRNHVTLHRTVKRSLQDAYEIKFTSPYMCIKSNDLNHLLTYKYLNK
jgi:hypothetical protein